MDIVRYFVSDIETVLVLILIAARIKTADHFVTFFRRKIRNLKHYVTCASEVDCVDLKDSHSSLYLTAYLSTIAEIEKWSFPVHLWQMLVMLLFHGWKLHVIAKRINEALVRSGRPELAVLKPDLS